MNGSSVGQYAYKRSKVKVIDSIHKGKDALMEFCSTNELSYAVADVCSYLLEHYYKIDMRGPNKPYTEQVITIL